MLSAPTGASLGHERFRSAPGPAGWRSFSTLETMTGTIRVDLAVDARWRPVRARLESDEHHLILVRRDDAFIALHDDTEELRFPRDDRTVVWFPSSSSFVALARGAEPGNVPLLRIDPATLEPALGTGDVERLGDDVVETAAGRFAAEGWRDPDGRRFWVAGDVLVRAEGTHELTMYEALSSGPAPLP